MDRIWSFPNFCATPKIIHSKGFSSLNHPAVGYPWRTPPIGVDGCRHGGVHHWDEFGVLQCGSQCLWQRPAVGVRAVSFPRCKWSQDEVNHPHKRVAPVSKNMCWTPFRGLNKYDKDDLMRMQRRIQIININRLTDSSQEASWRPSTLSA